jgi:hypothetical protein
MAHTRLSCIRAPRDPGCPLRVSLASSGDQQEHRTLRLIGLISMSGCPFLRGDGLADLLDDKTRTNQAVQYQIVDSRLSISNARVRKSLLRGTSSSASSPGQLADGVSTRRLGIVGSCRDEDGEFLPRTLRRVVGLPAPSAPKILKAVLNQTNADRQGARMGR